MKENKVGTNGKSPKQGLTITEILTLTLPVGANPLIIYQVNITSLTYSLIYGPRGQYIIRRDGPRIGCPKK